MSTKVFPRKYDRLGDFHDGFAKVQMSIVSEVIDRSGRAVAPCKEDADGAKSEFPVGIQIKVVNIFSLFNNFL